MTAVVLEVAGTVAVLTRDGRIVGEVNGLRVARDGTIVGEVTLEPGALARETRPE